MTPISCKRPTLLEPKAIGTSFVTNFLGQKNHIAVFTFAGDVYIAYEDSGLLTIRTSDGLTMNKGLAYRFIEHHLAALKEGAIPSRLSYAVVITKPNLLRKFSIPVHTEFDT